MPITWDEETRSLKLTPDGFIEEQALKTMLIHCVAKGLHAGDQMTVMIDAVECPVDESSPSVVHEVTFVIK